MVCKDLLDYCAVEYNDAMSLSLNRSSFQVLDLTSTCCLFCNVVLLCYAVVFWGP